MKNQRNVVGYFVLKKYFQLLYLIHRTLIELRCLCLYTWMEWRYMAIVSFDSFVITWILFVCTNNRGYFLNNIIYREEEIVSLCVVY